MMNKPIVERPTENIWINDDGEISSFIKQIKENTLNVNKRAFFNKKTQAEVSYVEVSKNIQSKFLKREFQDILIDTFQSLPTTISQLEKDLETILVRFIANTQEKTNFIKASQKYMDFIEKENKEMKAKVELWKKSITEYESQKGLSQLKQEIDQLQEQMLKMSGMLEEKKKKEVIEKEVKKIVPEENDSEEETEDVMDRY